MNLPPPPLCINMEWECGYITFFFFSPSTCAAPEMCAAAPANEEEKYPLEMKTPL